MKQLRALLVTFCLLAGPVMIHAQPEADASLPPFDVTGATIPALQQAMAEGEVSSEQLVELYLARIAAYEQQGPAINALIRVNPRAREQARVLDDERRALGPRGPLHGIPMIIKDNFNTADLPTTGASVALIDFGPGSSAAQVERLLDAGAIVLAKSNLHEFAYGITTISSLGGQTLNPYDPSRTPGGSSGGTAAAIAAVFAAVGMGSDTCGSIRIPAAFNNLVGLRPTKGLSSIYGVMPLASTQDVAGPLARSAADLAVVLDIVSGHDPRDPATALMRDRAPLEFREQIGTASLRGLRIGRLDQYHQEAEPALRAVLEAAYEEMERQGAVVVPFTIPDLQTLIRSSGVIGHEFEGDFDAYLQTFGSDNYPDLESIVASGLYHQAVHGVLSRAVEGERDEQAYQQALVARGVLRDVVETAMAEQEIDVIAYPPAGALPVRIGESQPGNNCSLSANSGLPAVSMPVGFTEDGLPVGIELLGAALSDARLVALAHAWEQATGHRRLPAATPPL